MPPTEQALLDHMGTATGRDGRYSVTWSDALYIGSQGYGIVLELERNGFTAGVPFFARAPDDDVAGRWSRPTPLQSSISRPVSTSTSGEGAWCSARWRS